MYPITRQQNFRLVKIETNRVENIMRKEKIACYEQFLLFSQCVPQQERHCLVMGFYTYYICSPPRQDKMQNVTYSLSNYVFNYFCIFMPYIYTPTKQMFFWGVLESACLSVCPCIRVPVYLCVHLCVRVSICVQNTSFCQSTGRGGINPFPNNPWILCTSP